MQKKVRKYAEGGVQEGPNKNITDDVRARAMRFLQGETELSGKYHGDEKPTPRAATRSQPPLSQVMKDVIEEGRRLDAARSGTSDTTPRTRSYKPAQAAKDIEPAWGISGFKAGGKVSSASKRADGIARKGKTRGKVC